MAKIIENTKGFRVIEVSLQECLGWCGLGLCDWCGKGVGPGYFVAVLNSVMCGKCYENWMLRAQRFEEDREFEEDNFNYMKERLGL